ncbi:MAG: polyphosphate kinase 1, partial [Methanomassiliicoccaceae archaeon]|nr:polyphosphate kinase 1 [Methanomassiliicoccaceae archaeon]
MSEIPESRAEISGCMQNRELSWLKFNRRVLEESDFRANTIVDRLKFIYIFCSNLDEFFMVRVGSLTDYMMFAPGYFDNKTGMSAGEQLNAVYAKMPELYSLAERYYSAVVNELAENGVHHLRMRDLDAKDEGSMRIHFEENILPILSPQLADKKRPFPHIGNKRIHVAVNLSDENEKLFGLIAVPRTLDRVVPIEGVNRFVLLEDLICHFAHLVFEPHHVKERTILAVTRNADINTEDGSFDEDADYRLFLQEQINMRQRLAPVRLEFQDEVSDDIRKFFTKKSGLKDKQVFVTSVPLDVSYCFRLEDNLSEELKKILSRPAHVPADVYPGDRKTGLMKIVHKKDVLFSYPFESISHFVDMIKEAANDPSVLSIKITLYRLDLQSRLVESLIRAAEKGKEVVVLMELRARFDETNNIEWSKRLDEAGCQVIYGLPKYKVHSKICLITSVESGGIVHVTQIGTGNYNERTAKVYTDLSVITSDPYIGNDAVRLFNNLLLGNLDGKYDRLWVAPRGLKQNILDNIDAEKQKGVNGRIIIKCNSLTDRDVIMKLADASQNGVRISMIVRGICCLIPGVPGLTDNISVISIIGRFLEHSRIYCFGGGDEMRMFISSADLMTRNTERRVEIAVPVLDADIKARIYGMLETMLKDNTKAWEQMN